MFQDTIIFRLWRRIRAFSALHTAGICKTAILSHCFPSRAPPSWWGTISDNQTTMWPGNTNICWPLEVWEPGQSRQQYSRRRQSQQLPIWLVNIPNKDKSCTENQPCSPSVHCVHKTYYLRNFYPTFQPDSPKQLTISR